MDIVREINNFQSTDKPIYLALGNFDGIHKGHQYLLKNAVDEAKKNAGLATAFIFDPHPNKVIKPDQNLKMITNSHRQAELLREIGIELLIYNTFNAEISKWQPEEFVEKIIISKLKAKHVFIGFNYSFGYKGSGSPELLQELGKKHGFEVSIVPPVSIDEQLVSSSLIRELIEKGQVKEAQKLLGHYPMVEGIVCHGDKRGGREMGFPTANLETEEDIIIPAKGVYAAKVCHNGIIHNCVVNVGSKPTFHANHPITVEVHIIGFNNDIYGDLLQISFIDRIRDEMKFDNIENLKKQIGQDKDLAYEITCKI